MKTFLAKLLLACGIAMAATVASAAYPEKPIRLVVPFPAGGPSDTAARLLGQALSKSLGQPVVVENRPGASGAIAAREVLNAPADGYTLMWGVASMAAIPLLQKSPPFQSLADFAPVGLVGRFGFGMYVHPGVSATSVAEFINSARANPDKLNYATGTLGEFMVAAQFMKAAGIRMVRVPYKGGAQAMPDLIAGRVQVFFTPISLGLSHARTGKVRMLASVLPQRSPLAPEVPTIAETGLSGVSVPTWQAIFAPPATPKPVIDRISREAASALQDANLRAQFEQQALFIEGSTPEALAAVVAEDVETWRRFVRENDIPQE